MTLPLCDTKGKKSIFLYEKERANSISFPFMSYSSSHNYVISKILAQYIKSLMLCGCLRKLN